VKKEYSDEKFEKTKVNLEHYKKEMKNRIIKLEKELQACCNHPELSKFKAEPTERMDVNYLVSYRCLKCDKHFGYHEEQPELEPKVIEIVNILGLTLEYIKK
jgi:hypothetical protein